MRKTLFPYRPQSTRSTEEEKEKAAGVLEPSALERRVGGGKGEKDKPLLRSGPGFREGGGVRANVATQEKKESWGLRRGAVFFSPARRGKRGGLLCFLHHLRYRGRERRRNSFLPRRQKGKREGRGRGSLSLSRSCSRRSEGERKGTSSSAGGAKKREDKSVRSSICALGIRGGGGKRGEGLVHGTE